MAYKILIVDDETATAFGLKALMESEDVVVLTASNAQTARRILGSEKVQVLLSDIRLSGTLDAEGLDLLTFAREKCAETKVILMTGYGDPAIMQKAFEMGASYYFEKPVEINVLSEAIHALGVPNRLKEGQV
ncbi:MAG: response regulator [Acidobacteriota bacterium]